MVVNGGFDSADTSYFTPVNGAILSAPSGKLITLNQATNGGFSLSLDGLLIGHSYRVSAVLEAIAGVASVNIYANNAILQPNVLGVGTTENDFLWNGVNAILMRYAGAGQSTLDQFGTDSVSVKEVLKNA